MVGKPGGGLILKPGGGREVQLESGFLEQFDVMTVISSSSSSWTLGRSVGVGVGK